jgi:hypothetical protein
MPSLFFFYIFTENSIRIQRMFTDHFKAMTLFGKGKYVVIEVVRSKERSSNREYPPYLLQKCDR